MNIDFEPYFLEIDKLKGTIKQEVSIGETDVYDIFFELIAMVKKYIQESDEFTLMFIPVMKSNILQDFLNRECKEADFIITNIIACINGLRAMLSFNPNKHFAKSLITELDSMLHDFEYAKLKRNAGKDNKSPMFSYNIDYISKFISTDLLTWEDRWNYINDMENNCRNNPFLIDSRHLFDFIYSKKNELNSQKKRIKNNDRIEDTSNKKRIKKPKKLIQGTFWECKKVFRIFEFIKEKKMGHFQISKDFTICDLEKLQGFNWIGNKNILVTILFKLFDDEVINVINVDDTFYATLEQSNQFYIKGAKITRARGIEMKGKNAIKIKKEIISFINQTMLSKS